MISKLMGMIRAMNWKRTLGYVALFQIFFIIFLYLTFPYDAVKNALVAQVEQKASLDVKIGKLTPYRLTGLLAKNVLVTEQDNPANVLVNLDKVKLRLHLLPLLIGKVVADYDFYLAGGGLAGQFILKGKEMAVAANFKDFQIERLNPDKQLKKFGEVKIKGVVNGNYQFYVNNESPRDNQGHLALNYNGFRITNTTILGNKVPDIVFQDPVEMEVSLKNRALSIDKWNMTSPDLDIKASGRITPKEDVGRSRLNLKFQIKPSEKLEDAFGAMAFFLPEPDNDGYYNITLTGTPKAPRVRK